MNIITKILCLSVQRISTNIGGDGLKRYQETLKFSSSNFSDLDSNGPPSTPSAVIDIVISDQKTPDVFEPGIEYDVTIMPSPV